MGILRLRCRGVDGRRYMCTRIRGPPRPKHATVAVATASLFSCNAPALDTLSTVRLAFLSPRRTTMLNRNRRQFLADVGKGMLLASVGPALAAELGVSRAFAGESA